MVNVKDQSSHFVYLNICIKKQPCENFNSIGCEIIMEERNTLVTRSCVLSDAWFPDLRREVSKSIQIFYFFLENYVTSEGAISNNVLYYQQLSITNSVQCLEVMFTLKVLDRFFKKDILLEVWLSHVIPRWFHIHVWVAL